MKTRILTLVLFIASSLVGFARYGGPSWYAYVMGGGAFSQNAKLTDTTPNSISFDPGYDVSGALGYRVYEFGDHLDPWYVSVEAEGAWRRTIANKVTFNSTGYNTGARADYISAMANVALQIPLYREWLFAYVGGGLGAADVEVRMMNNPTLRGSDQAWVLAYQGFTGLGIKLTDTISLRTGYRYFTTLNPKLRIQNTNVTYKSPGQHIIEGGLMFEF